MQSVTSDDGTRISYEKHGEGSPLLLIHGGSSPKYWKPLIPNFADNHTVIVPHRRGVGKSDDSEDYSLEKGVEDIQAVINNVSGTPSLFGHSFGGLLALETARRTPIKSLFVYEPAILVGDYREQASLADQMQTHLKDGDRREAMKFYVREVMHGGEIENLDAWLRNWPPWPDIAELAENIVRINHAIEQYRLPDSITVDAPTLLLTGTEGPPHLKDGIRALYDAMDEGQILEFDGLGHGGPSEAPEQVLPEIQEFLRSTNPQVSN
jgi:pimeloyl-ACP methyl ester carboxylesterase